jgi:hypothetical protein
VESELAVELIGSTKRMGVVLSEPAHPEETMQYSRPFVAIDRSQFRETKRQLPIGAAPAPVDEDVKRTIHRLDPIQLVLVDLHPWIHVLGVEAEMA